MESGRVVHRVYPAAAPGGVLVLAHGAGAGQASSFMVRTARGLAERGVAVVTFDFPYITARRKLPDAAPVLERAWRAAIDHARRDPIAHGRRLFIGGKSMGGRIASHVAADGVDEVAGLVFLGYPLHPPGRPHQRRDAHLPNIREPMLFVQGERDAFGSADEIRGLLAQLNAATTLHVVPAGDHSYRVPARSRPQDAVYDEVVEVTARWIQEQR